MKRNYEPENAVKTSGRINLESMYSTIRDRICLMGYPPGTVLKEADLAEEFKISRTPVRQILQRLQSDGLVISKHGFGTIVTDANLDELQDDYEFRIQFIAMFGKMAKAKCKNRQIAEMTEILSSLEDLLHSRGILEFWSLSHRQHKLLRGVIRNETYKVIWDLLYYKTSRIWYRNIHSMWYEEMHNMIDETKEIIEAMRKNDMNAIGMIKKKHTEKTLQRIETYFSELALVQAR